MNSLLPYICYDTSITESIKFYDYQLRFSNIMKNHYLLHDFMFSNFPSIFYSLITEFLFITPIHRKIHIKHSDFIHFELKLKNNHNHKKYNYRKNTFFFVALIMVIHNIQIESSKKNFLFSVKTFDFTPL